MKFQLAILVACAAVLSLHLEGASAEHQKRSVVSDLLKQVTNIVNPAVSQINSTLQTLGNVVLTVQNSLQSTTQDVIEDTLNNLITRVEELSGQSEADFINCTEVQNFTSSVSNEIAGLGLTCTDEALSGVNAVVQQLEDLLDSITSELNDATDAAEKCQGLSCLISSLPEQLTSIVAVVTKDVSEIATLVETATTEGNPVSIIAKGVSCLTSGVASVTTQAAKLLSIVNNCLETTTDDATNETDP